MDPSICVLLSGMGVLVVALSVDIFHRVNCPYFKQAPCIYA